MDAENPLTNTWIQRKYEIRQSTLQDYSDWIVLAKEVEPLFGPMIENASFCAGLKRIIQEKNAFCAVESNKDGFSLFHGGIAISKEANEISWFAVFQRSQGRGLGSALLRKAISWLDRNRPITVTTFDQAVKAGRPARKIYQRQGFIDSAAAGSNPAGISIVTMTLTASRQSVRQRST